MRQTLPRTATYSQLDFWVDEGIWGHRLYDEQPPWLCLMEFLGVLNSEYQKGTAFIEQTYNSLSYRANSRIYLRNLLFNNPYIEVVYRDYQEHKDEKRAWEEWLQSAKQHFAGIAFPDLTYLQSNFVKFDDFYETINFMQNNTIEGENNKRWSSQFIFPYGKECLYVDLRIDGDHKIQNDRRFFARTGELLYLMISRSGKSDEILSFFESNILNSNSTFSKLAKKLQPNNGVEDPMNEQSGAFLPYECLQEYSNLAQDWINIIYCKIPAYDKIPHLVNIMGLHLVIYFLNRAKDVLNQKEKVVFVLEILAPKKTIIRDLASDSYINNNNLSRQAIEQYIRSVIETDEWQELLTKSDPVDEAIKFMQKKFLWPSKSNEDLSSFDNPNDLIDELVHKATLRHKQHVSNFHRVWGKEIGLSSSRNSQRIRYIPTDSLLKTLVLTNVPDRMEFQEFLNKLYEKYGFIIGDKEAIEVTDSGQADLEAFSENAFRLEERLSSMGLLRRLSDAVAYVENPFAKDGF